MFAFMGIGPTEMIIIGVILMMFALPAVVAVIVVVIVMKSKKARATSLHPCPHCQSPIPTSSTDCPVCARRLS